MTFELSRARAASFAALLAVLVAAALVLGWDLGGEKLENWDEAIYAEVARQIHVTENWVSLSWNGEPWFEKPPLLPWLTAVAYFAMGVDEASARIVSALAGVGLAVLTFFMAGGYRRCWTGLLAAGVLLGSDFVRRYARVGTTDILLTFFCYLALAGYLSVEAERRGWGWLFVGAGVGLGFMTKSVAILVVPAAIALDLTMGHGLRRTLRSRGFWLGVALGSVIVLPWHLLMIAAEGHRFLDVYFGVQVLERAGTPLEGNAAPPQYYVEELRGAFGVWVYLLPFAIAQGVLQATRGDRVSRLLSILIGIVGVLYAVIETKLTWYMAPAVPALAILLAHYVITAVGRREPAQLAGLGIASFAAALHLSGWAALVSAALIPFSLSDRRPSFRRVAAAASMVMILPFFLVTAIDLASREEGNDEPASMVRLLRHVTSSDRIAPPVLYVYRVDEPTAVFYSHRPVRVIATEAELFRVVEQDKEIVLIGRPNTLGEILHRFRFERIHQEGKLVALVVSPLG